MWNTYKFGPNINTYSERKLRIKLIEFEHIIITYHYVIQH